jgi:hypothetical protein
VLTALGRTQTYAEEPTMTDSQFSKDGLRRLHEAMAAYVDSGERPGIVTLLSKNVETHVDAIGTHEFGGGRPMPVR